MDETLIDAKQMAQEFWDWSGRAYNKSEVRDCLLDLQDSFDLNVNFLLLAVWAEQQAIAIDAELWRSIHVTTDQANETVKKIRQQRRQAKRLEPSKYQQLLKLELQGEQIIQKKSIHTLCQQGSINSIASNRERVKLNHNLNGYIVAADEVEHVSHDAETIGKRRSMIEDLGLLVQNLRF